MASAPTSHRSLPTLQRPGIPAETGQALGRLRPVTERCTILEAKFSLGQAFALAGRYSSRVLRALSDSVSRIAKSQGSKLLRFGAVSVFNVVFGQALLFGAQTLVGWTAVQSNIFSVAVSAIPAYLLSRYWVWQKRGRNHFMREVVPFWSLALLGFALSTAAVWYVERRWDPQPIFINLTNLFAFGVVWLSKFFVLDRILFKHEDLTDDSLDALVSEIVHPHRSEESGHDE